MGEKYVQEEFLGEESLGEKYMDETYVQEEFLCQESRDEKSKIGKIGGKIRRPLVWFCRVMYQAAKH